MKKIIRKNSLKINPQIITLVLIVVFGVAFSFVQIGKAATPNPGHTWSELVGDGPAGINTSTPASLLELWNATNTANMTATSSQLTITMATSGTSYDPQIVFRTGTGSPTSRFTLGVDYSAGTNFVISTTTLGTSDLFSINFASTSFSFATNTFPGLFNIATSSPMLTILPNGFLGLGTAGPAVKLDISAGNLRLSDSQNLQWGGTTNFITGSNASNFLALNTNNLERARIDSSGNLGLGTSSPASLLELWNATNTGNMTATSSQLTITMATSGTGFDPQIVFRTGAGSPTSRFTLGVDYSAGTNFVISTTTLGTSDLFSINFASTSFSFATNTFPGLFNIATSSPMLTILPNGYVGLGTAGPAVKLDISSGNLRLSDSQNLQWGGTTNFITGSNASNFLTFNTNNLERARIDSSGNVGIGTTTPASILHVASSTATTTITIGTETSIGCLRMRDVSKTSWVYLTASSSGGFATTTSGNCGF